MFDALLAHEPVLRLTVFASVFALMAIWEVAAPIRRQTLPRQQRWPSNLGIAVLDTLAVRILFPTGAVAVALFAEAKGLGLLNWTGVPAVVAIPLAIVVLDLAIYLQHVAFHHVPLLWRVHRMHHSDQDLDVTSGARFHPIEILLSMLIKAAVILTLGAPAAAVLLFEVLLNATSMFNHANVTLPAPVERALRWVVVTPDMHRVHHSIVRAETNSNFGFNLPWWDRLFGTYRREPTGGQKGMTIGIEQFRQPAEQRLDRMLTQPFRRDERRVGSAGE